MNVTGLVGIAKGRFVFMTANLSSMDHICQLGDQWTP